jgi:hypothetical protein
MDFLNGFLVVLNVFHQFLFKIITNLKFYKRCFIKDYLVEAFLYSKEIHRLGFGFKNL